MGGAVSVDEVGPLPLISQSGKAGSDFKTNKQTKKLHNNLLSSSGGRGGLFN